MHHNRNKLPDDHVNRNRKKFTPFLLDYNLKEKFYGKSALDAGLGLATNLAAPILTGFAKNALASAKGNLFRILLDSFYISIRQNKLVMRDMMHPDLYVNINVHGHNTFSFSKAQTIVDMGYKQVKETLDKQKLVALSKPSEK